MGRSTMELSSLAQSSGGSVIREMYNEAMKHEDTISFTVGEPDFVTPRRIVNEACINWQRGLTHYTPNRGIEPLLQEIARYHSQDLHPDWTSQILVTCGATEALQLALFAVVNPGDEVILVTPAWPNYFGQIAMCGASVREVEAREENGFVPKIEEIEQAISGRTRALILNSPCNPTGAVMDRETCQQLAELLCKRNLYVIADEVYSKLVYGDEPFTSMASFPQLSGRLIYINSFSKMFAMTGWRLGYAVGPPQVIAAMTKLHENGASCLPEPSQLAAAEGLRSCLPELELMRRTYETRRELACGIVEQIPGISLRRPGGAFYLFLNIKETGMNSRDFCMGLLRKTGVVMVPGNGFGAAGEGYVRMTYAASEENICRGLERVNEYLQKTQTAKQIDNV